MTLAERFIQVRDELIKEGKMRTCFSPSSDLGVFGAECDFCGEVKLIRVNYELLDSIRQVELEFSGWQRVEGIGDLCPVCASYNYN